jgi:hypothetical protein
MKDPFAAVTGALKEDNVVLLQCYLRSMKEGCGIVGGDYIYRELAERGYTQIDQYVSKWRIDLRKELLGFMQNLPGVMGAKGIPAAAVDCMVMAYIADDQRKAEEVATLIRERILTDPVQLAEAMEAARQHPASLSSGAL